MKIQKAKSIWEQRFRSSPAGLKQRLVQTLTWPTELTHNLVPKPGMMEEEKGLVNQSMVKRSCHGPNYDAIIRNDTQKNKELTVLRSRRRKG